MLSVWTGNNITSKILYRFLLLNPLFIMFMFVGARVWDAVNDPIMGKICDKLKVSKWGRYRPWFLYGSIPLALSAILMFVKWPGFGSETSSFGVYM